MSEAFKIVRTVMYEDFAAALRELIRSKQLRGKYLAPERDLAKAFDVCRETVRKGLALLEEQKIVERRQGCGTYVLPKVRKSRENDARRILIGTYQPVDDTGTPDKGLMSGIAEALGDGSALLSFMNLTTPASRRKFFAGLSNSSASAVMLISVTDRQLVEDVAAAWRGPAVLVDHFFDGVPVPGVVDDSEGGMRQLVGHLVERGHRRIGYVECSRRELNPWRYAGYVSGLKAAGITPDPGLVVPSFGGFESGRAAGEALLTRRNRATAIVTFDDVRAWGVWRAAEALGLEIGRDVALAGFGDTAAGLGFPDELTSVRFDPRSLGRLAVKDLRAQMKGKARQSELITAPTKLMIRKSSASAAVRKS